MNEFKPTTTQYPNFLFELMPLLCESEIKVLNAIVRKTYGWHKDRDKISLSQMMALTGLSRQGCLDGKDGLVSKGIISVSMVNGITEYLVNEPDQSTNQTSLLGGKGGLLETKQVVNEVDTQKKVITKEIIQKKEEERAPGIPIKQNITDPFIPVHDFDGSNLVFKILTKNNIFRHKTPIPSDPTNCNAIYQLLISDDKESELTERLLQYEYSWWGEQKKMPNAKNVFKAWDQLTPGKVPHWIREGHATERDYKQHLVDKREHERQTEQENRLQQFQAGKRYDPNTDPAMLAVMADFETLKVKESA